MPITKIPAKSKAIKKYSSLKTAVAGAVAMGQLRAARAIERERVLTAWAVGKLISEHIQFNKSKGPYYGTRVIERLARDTKISETELNKTIEFFRAYPKNAPARFLSWSHFRELLVINHNGKRNALAHKAEKNKWTRKRLRSEIKKVKKKTKPFKSTVPGTLGVYRVRKVGKKSLIDLGFSTYLEKKSVKRKIKVVKNRDFTYLAEVERVVDGDTLWCVVDLGLGVKTHQKLRLRGLNAPEIKSKEGEASKRYLTRLLKGSNEIIIKTTRSDKYDRFLSDIWVGDTYINEHLINQGYAVVV